MGLATFYFWCGSVSGGRLECTMQNIADSFFSTSSSPFYGRVEGKSLLISCLKFVAYHFLSIFNILFAYKLPSWLHCRQIIWIRLLCIMNEDGLHHLLRGKENMQTSLYTRSYFSCHEKFPCFHGMENFHPYFNSSLDVFYQNQSLILAIDGID